MQHFHASPDNDTPRAGLLTAGSNTINPVLRRTAWWFAVILILFTGVVTRLFTVCFPHDHGDQIIYTALADTIQHGRGYTLTMVALTSMPLQITGARRISFLPAQSSTQSVAGLFKSGGADIYQDPLFFRVPLFPLTLNMSRILTGRERQQLLSLPAMRRTEKPADYFFRWRRAQSTESLMTIAGMQLPATTPPLFFSILILFISILWVRRYSPAAALWAGLILALCPINILTATRIYPDSMMTALLLISILALDSAAVRPRPFSPARITLLVCAVLAGGAASYTKESAFFILATTALVLSLDRTKRTVCIIYCGCLVIMLLPWLWFMHTYNGRWLPMAHWASPVSAYWYSVTSQRSFLFHISQPLLLCPVFFFGLAWFMSLVSRKRWWLDTGFLVIFITISSATCLKAFESRQILPAYPFLAIAAAWGLERWRHYVAKRFQPVAGYAAVLLVIGLSAGWGLYRSYIYIMGNAGDIFLQ